MRAELYRKRGELKKTNDEKNKNRNNIINTTSAIVAALLLVASIACMAQTTKAFATASRTLDQNGIKRVDPLFHYSLEYGNEWYTFIKNFRSDGSMRMDFKGREADSAMLAGYFRIQSGDCDSIPNEEIAAKLNGGPHTSTQPDDPDNPITPVPNAAWADNMDLGTDFEGQDSRVRWEKVHPYYSGSIAPSNTKLPLATDMCSTPDGWVGYMSLKINLDSNCNGIIDRIGLFQYVDISGLNPTTGKPQNKWTLTFAKNFVISDIVLKSKIQPYVEDIGYPEYKYQTIRIDGQSQSEWQSTTNPPYKFVTLKEIVNVHKDDGSC